jgi:hypothetical protein
MLISVLNDSIDAGKREACEPPPFLCEKVTWGAFVTESRQPAYSNKNKSKNNYAIVQL